jgi:ribosome maturation factor RimP
LLYKRWLIIETELKLLKEKISKVLSSKNIIVDEVTYRKEGTINFLEIVLDQDGGIDLDTIVDATNIINPIVDEMDFIDESFIMDVVSKERGDE